jgi:hypothetical protein
MIWSQYFSIKCNGCEAHYYVNTGDPRDDTRYEVTAAKCPWCGAVEQLGDEFEWDDNEESGNDAELGKKSLPECRPQTKPGKAGS